MVYYTYCRKIIIKDINKLNLLYNINSIYKMNPPLIYLLLILIFFNLI